VGVDCARTSVTVTGTTLRGTICRQKNGRRLYIGMDTSSKLRRDGQPFIHDEALIMGVQFAGKAGKTDRGSGQPYPGDGLHIALSL
jgi:hypothetical protein